MPSGDKAPVEEGRRPDSANGAARTSNCQAGNSISTRRWRGWAKLSMGLAACFSVMIVLREFKGPRRVGGILPAAHTGTGDEHGAVPLGRRQPVNPTATAGSATPAPDNVERIRTKPPSEPDGVTRARPTQTLSSRLSIPGAHLQFVAVGCRNCLISLKIWSRYSADHTKLV